MERPIDNKTWIWMLVTLDEYQFPLVIADSVYELAERTNKSVESIRSQVSKWERGKVKRSSVVRVRR